MVEYCVPAQIRKRLIGVSPAVMSDSDIRTHIIRAENLINVRISNRYRVPFTIVPPIVETLAIEISSYFIMTTLFTDDSQNKNEWVAVFKESIQTLKDIADGKIEIIDSVGNPLDSRVQSVQSSMQNYTPVFAMDEVEYQKIDSDLLKNISRERN